MTIPIASSCTRLRLTPSFSLYRFVVQVSRNSGALIFAPFYSNSPAHQSQAGPSCDGPVDKSCQCPAGRRVNIIRVPPQACTGSHCPACRSLSWWTSRRDTATRPWTVTSWSESRPRRPRSGSQPESVRVIGIAGDDHGMMVTVAWDNSYGYPRRKLFPTWRELEGWISLRKLFQVPNILGWHLASYCAGLQVPSQCKS